MIMVDGVPSLTEADSWFDKKALPARTTSSGFSWNRVYKSPHRLVAGNQTDPNGLCGDASSYVIEAFDKAFPKANPTSDGFMLGLVLWEGMASNHIANVMLPQDAAHKQSFQSKGGVVILTDPASGKLGERVSGSSPRSRTRYLGAKELLGLHVYDLYYKKRTTIADWWDEIDSKGGTITVGMEHEFT
jgi:hypothetical protein